LRQRAQREPAGCVHIQPTATLGLRAARETTQPGAGSHGGRQLIGADAISVRIEPTLYKGATALNIDAQIPPGIRVDLPARDPDRIPRPETARPPAAASAAGGRITPNRLQVGALGLVTLVVGALALGVTVAMIIGAMDFRLLPAIGAWIITGYLGRAFLGKWQGQRNWAEIETLRYRVRHGRRVRGTAGADSPDDLLRLLQAHLAREYDRLRTIGHLQFAEDVRDVVAHRLRRQ
jgi:hypothetical protein